MTDFPYDNLPEENEQPLDLADSGYSGYKPEAAPNDDVYMQEIADQMHSQEHEQDHINPFEFNFEEVSLPDVKPAKVAEQDEFLEDWERQLLEARESRMNKIAGGSFIVNGLIQANETGIMYGDSGAKKTFLAIHIASCVAKGINCFGKGVRHGLVYYFAAEDPAGVRERVRGWEEAYNDGKPLPTMQVIPRAFDLLDQAKQDKFVASVEALYSVLPPDRRKTSLIVIDTLSTNNGLMSLGGKPVDENSNNDMATVMAKATELTRRLGCALLFIHHSGKDSEKGARGASAIRANAGFEIKVRGIKDQTSVIIEPTKIKMSAMLPKRKIDFRAQPLPKELLAERELARAELTPDEDAGWHVDEYETTLVPINKLQYVDKDDEIDVDEKQSKKPRITNAESIALYVRKNANYHGMSEEDIISFFTTAGQMGTRAVVRRSIKECLDRGYVQKTSAGNFKHNQQMTDRLAEQKGETVPWSAPKND